MYEFAATSGDLSDDDSETSVIKVGVELEQIFSFPVIELVPEKELSLIISESSLKQVVTDDVKFLTKIISWSRSDVELYVALVDDWTVEVTPPVTFKNWYQLPDPIAEKTTLSPTHAVFPVRLLFNVTVVVGETFIEYVNESW